MYFREHAEQREIMVGLYSYYLTTDDTFIIFVIRTDIDFGKCRKIQQYRGLSRYCSSLAVAESIGTEQGASLFRCRKESRMHLGPFATRICPSSRLSLSC